MPANLPPGYVPEGATASLEGGIPWEQKEGGLLGKWWETVKACNGQTRPFFACAAQNEKGDALTFAMMSGVVSGAFVGLFYVLMLAMISAGFMMAAPSLGGGKGSAGASVLLTGIGLGIGIFYALMLTVMTSVLSAVRPFLVGGLHHVILAMFGGIGERKTFMHTVRVVAYAEGAAAPWIWIPIAGPFIVLFYGIKNVVQGYDETHRCGVGKALLALLAPILCCCACNVLLALLGAMPAILKP